MYRCTIKYNTGYVMMDSYKMADQVTHSYRNTEGISLKPSSGSDGHVKRRFPTISSYPKL